MATEDNWKCIIRTNYPDLLEVIDTENGLRGEIKKLDVFRPIALKSFWGYTDTTKRIDRMLQNLQKTDFGTFTLFCDALSNSKQGHVVEKNLSQVKDTSSEQMTMTDSAAGVDSSQNRGISHDMRECLRLNWNKLIFFIEFDEALLAKLENVTPVQLKTLRDKTTETDRTEHMLILLEQGSEMRFESFCRALENSKQGHIVVEYLTLNQDQRSSSIPDLLPSTNSSPGESTRSLPVAPAPLQREPQEVLLSGVEFSSCTDEFCKKIDDEVRSKLAYRCDRKPRGRAIIISNEEFRVKHLSRRYGTQNDVSSLKKLFLRLHFDTEVYEDKTAEEILEILENESKDAGNFHVQCDMFVLFIMSHGICGEVFGVDGKPVKTTAILQLFNGENCSKLCSKPKLIFIQACQGDQATTGVPASDGNMTATDSGIEGAYSSSDSDMLEKLKAIEDVELSLPLDPLPLYQADDHLPERVHKLADMALIYATVEGDKAWRDVDTGGLFVQALVDIFTKNAHKKDVMSMITYVIGKLHDEGVDDGKSRYKQIAKRRDTLRKAIYLLP